MSQPPPPSLPQDQVRAYHHNISQHVLSLIHTAGQIHSYQSHSSQTTPKPTPTPTLPPTLTPTTSTSNPNPNLNTIPSSSSSPNRRRAATLSSGLTSSGTETESRTTSTSTSTSSSSHPTPPDQTARPIQHPIIIYPDFPSDDLTPIQRRSGNSSGDGDRNGDGNSSEFEIGQEIESREAEQQRAWETDGCRVWKYVPQGFELKLGKSRDGSESSSNSAYQTKSNSAYQAQSKSTSYSKSKARSIPTSVSHTTTTTSDNISSSLNVTCSVVSSSVSRKSRSVGHGSSSSTTRSRERTYDEKRQLRLQRNQAELSLRISTWLQGIVTSSFASSAPPSPSPSSSTPSFPTSILSSSTSIPSSSTFIPSSSTSITIYPPEIDESIPSAREPTTPDYPISIIFPSSKPLPDLIPPNRTIRVDRDGSDMAMAIHLRALNGLMGDVRIERRKLGDGEDVPLVFGLCDTYRGDGQGGSCARSG